MVYLILNGIEVTSREQLEELILDLPEESKVGLRLIFDQAAEVN
jgi:hypothetical protein